METSGEEGPFDLRKVFCVGTFANPNVAATRRDGDFFVGHDGDGSEFQDLAFGCGDFFAKIIF